MALLEQPGSPPDGETEALIARARAYGKQGDFAHAARLYRAAIDRLPEGAPQRPDLEQIVAILEAGSPVQPVTNAEPPSTPAPQETLPSQPLPEIKSPPPLAPEPRPADWYGPTPLQYAEETPQPGVPLWLWGAAFVTLAVVCGAIIFGLYI